MAIECACEAELRLLQLCNLVGVKPVRPAFRPRPPPVLQSRSKATDEVYKEFFFESKEKKDRKKQKFSFTPHDTHYQKWMHIGCSYLADPQPRDLATQPILLISFAMRGTKHWRAVAKAEF
jgi:hypothetical protein